MKEKESKSTNPIERFKKFTPMHWILLVCIIMFAVGFLWMIVIWTGDFATGTPFITAAGESSGTIGEELYAYEITLYVIFWLLFLMLCSLFVYELSFHPLDRIVHDDINRKELMGDTVIDVHDTYKEKYEGKEEKEEK